MNTKVIKIILLVTCGLFVMGCRNNSASNMVSENSDSEEILEMDKAFFEALLDSFCQKHYDKKLKKGTYISNSIQVTDFSQDANTVRVEGTHSFEGVTSVFRNRMFWATIQIVDNNTFEINFSREKVNPLEGYIPDNIVDEIVGLDRIETGYVPFQFAYNN